MNICHQTKEHVCNKTFLKKQHRLNILIAVCHEIKLFIEIYKMILFFLVLLQVCLFMFI